MLVCVHAYTHIYKQVDPRVPPTQLPLVNEKYKQKHRFHPKKKNREKKLMAKSRYRKPAPSSKDSLKMPLSLSRVHSQWQRLKRVLHLKLYMRMEILFFLKEKKGDSGNQIYGLGGQLVSCVDRSKTQSS